MSSSLGGGAIIAFAAVLWLVYLAPSFVRRRQYLATERNAVRLQQTLRILAETAEVPDEVRAEVSARSVAEQHRALRNAARRAETVARPREVAAQRSLARRSAMPREPRSRAFAVAEVADARLNRSRALAAVLLLLSAGAIVVGLVQTATGGIGWALVAGIVGALTAVALLHRAATVAAAHRVVEAVDAAVPVPDAPQSFVDWAASAPERPTWTPVPLPRPRYLEHDDQAAVAVGAAAVDVAAAADDLRIAAEQAETALRAAGNASGVTAIDALRRLPTGYAAMGLLQPTEPVLHDLDAVLRRRRAG